jgi:hypothetical protein
VREYDDRAEKSQYDLTTIQGELESWRQLDPNTEEKYHKWLEVVDKTRTWMLDGVKVCISTKLTENMLIFSAGSR